MSVVFKEKQPKGLRVLFMTELWERFAFYTVQTLLILYMSEKLNLSDDRTFLLFGIFSALLYLTPVIGGYLADKYFGFQQSIVFGGWLFVIGYLLLALPHPHAFYLGLSVIIVANGLFKPNVTSILGELYEGPEDHRRDPGYTLFYMGMNIGSLFPPLFLGTLVVLVNWSAGFLAAALGMFLSMVVYYLGRYQLNHAGGIPKDSVMHHPYKKKRVLWILLLGIVASIAVIDVLMRFTQEANYFVIIASIAFLLVMIYFLFQEKGRDRMRMGAALILTVISGGFWTFYTQGSTSVVLFAKRNMSKHILGFPIDAEGTLFFNPFFIIILSPLISKLWINLSRKNKDWTTPIKFAWGVFFMAFGYLILGIGCKFFGHEAFVSPWWVGTSFFFQAFGELLLSPVGLAMITTLSPHRHIGIMMGFWFLIQAAASAVGGKLATFATILPHFSFEESLRIYSHAFLLFFWLCFVLAIIAFICVPMLNRMIHPKSRNGDREP